jgi:hypothetical protein
MLPPASGTPQDVRLQTSPSDCFGFAPGGLTSAPYRYPVVPRSQVALAIVRSTVGAKRKRPESFGRAGLWRRQSALARTQHSDYSRPSKTFRAHQCCMFEISRRVPTRHEHFVTHGPTPEHAEQEISHFRIPRLAMSAGVKSLAFCAARLSCTASFSKALRSTVRASSFSRFSAGVRL